MAVLDKLESGEGFTAAERTIARYIITHLDEVPRLNIGVLAEATFTSNATIIRFCRKLGQSGYRAFRVELAADLERRRALPVSMGVDRPIRPGENAKVVTSRLATLLKEAIDSCYAALDTDALEQAARLVIEAPEVLVFAAGDSQISAEAFANMMLKLGIRVIICDRHSETLANALAARPGDVAIVISYSGKIMHYGVTAEAIAQLRARSCHIVLISRTRAHHPDDVSITFPAREADAGKVATFYSQMCIRYILNCLYGTVYALSTPEETDRKRLLDTVDLALTLQPSDDTAV